MTLSAKAACYPHDRVGHPDNPRIEMTHTRMFPSIPWFRAPHVPSWGDLQPHFLMHDDCSGFFLRILMPPVIEDDNYVAYFPSPHLLRAGKNRSYCSLHFTFDHGGHGTGFLLPESMVTLCRD